MARSGIGQRNGSPRFRSDWCPSRCRQGGRHEAIGGRAGSVRDECAAGGAMAEASHAGLAADRGRKAKSRRPGAANGGRQAGFFRRLEDERSGLFLQHLRQSAGRDVALGEGGPRRAHGQLREGFPRHELPARGAARRSIRHGSGQVRSDPRPAARTL